MLVLSRKIGERILIGHQIVVKVIGVRGREVRLAFEAPEEVGIWLEEAGLTNRVTPANAPAQVTS